MVFVSASGDCIESVIQYVSFADHSCYYFVLALTPSAARGIGTEWLVPCDLIFADDSVMLCKKIVNDEMM